MEGNKMFYRMVVFEALKRSWASEVNTELNFARPGDDKDCVTSQLIHDFFGGEILKTPASRGWHFYNRIDGERIDFTRSEKDSSTEDIRFEDIPSSPDETYNYFEQEEYSTFLMRFIGAFEEAVGLERFRPGYTS